MTTGKNILSIKDLTAGYNGKPVLNGLNLSLEEGEICSVIGEEGSGKSTLVKSLTQQINSSGKIIYKGVSLQTISTARMTKVRIDFIAQGGNILKGFTVGEHISLALSGKSQEQKNILWKEIEAVFPKMFQLKKQIAGTLSGGERMILSMACVLATDANLLVLDEPTAGLAPEICNVIRNFLLRMKNEKNKTILLMEHNYDFTVEISDSVVILKEGKLTEKYFPNDFRKNDFIETKLYSIINS